MPRVPDDYLEARRREILFAAHRCFAENGFAETRMADVAETAGLSTGALYRYFEGKEALLRAVAEQGREFARRLREEVEESGDPYRDLLELVRRYLAQIGPETTPLLRFSVLMWEQALRDETVGEEVRRSYRELVGAFEEVVTRCIASGQIRTDLRPRPLAQAIVALLNEAGLAQALGLEPDLEAYGEVVEALIAGLCEPGE